MPSASWRSSAKKSALVLRADLNHAIRTYFRAQQVLEVETPLLSQAATSDPHIDSFALDYSPLGSTQTQSVYLHTSPEFAMKRLLCDGSGDIYSLAKVFRNGESSARHNPEFSMLEWYRLGFDEQRLMDDMTSMLNQACGFTELRRVSYAKLFEEYLGINPHRISLNQLQALVHKRIDAYLKDLDRNSCLELLFAQFIEPSLGMADEGLLVGVYVYDFPASMSALARLKLNEAGDTVAARFELYIDGLELANGYHELCDAEELRRRWEADQVSRGELAYAQRPIDENLLAAMDRGLPDCAGVAIGLDRLLMLMSGTRDIAEVLAFDFSRA